MNNNSKTVGIAPVLSEGIAAARAGHVEELRGWLARGNDPNQYDADGWTALLWASVRGHAESVELLINNNMHPADVTLPHQKSEGLAIHLAGHSGDVKTAEKLLNRKPEHLNAVWDLNGHGILLQAAFYGHLDLAKFLLEKGADTSLTTARGLGPLEMAAQFQNQAMVDLIKPYDSPKEAKAAYYQGYLNRIAPIIPAEQKLTQQLSDELVKTIEDGIENAAIKSDSVQLTLNTVKDLIENRKAEVNRLGGALQQPPLITVATGNNGFPPNPDLTFLRNELTKYLLEHGADPAQHEKHPMGVQTIIRAAVFNHLDILKMCGEYMTPQELADAINEIPVVNGLTAMHDTVLRATMAADDRFQGYLEQARWFVEHGGRSDMKDFSGVTQRNIAERAENAEVRKQLLDVLIQ